MISIKLGDNSGGAGTGGAGGGGFKKGGFKKTGFKAAFPSSNTTSEKKDDTAAAMKSRDEVEERMTTGDQLAESDTEDEGYEVYDPRHPTD